MEHTTDIDEQNLIDKITTYIRRGDHRAAATEFAHIVRRYSQQILDFTTRMVTNREDAEDVAQNVFVKAFRKFDTFQGRAALATWLSRIAYNESIDLINSRKHNTINIDDASIDSCEISDEEFSTGDEIRIQQLEE
ncbi:MAG: sigma-70 family RNA polymerase sigma factor, partial [Bacteroidales bacterium]|nr:sigma-70 family RNA polymerase sigma factor [Bacteroidales bacterium]